MALFKSLTFKFMQKIYGVIFVFDTFMIDFRAFNVG